MQQNPTPGTVTLRDADTLAALTQLRDRPEALLNFWHHESFKSFVSQSANAFKNCR